MEIFYAVLQLLAGLGVFMYAVNLVSSALEHVAGARLRTGISRLTDNKYKSLGFGIFVTGILQSSSASISMLVGFVSAGIITLAQVVPIIVGANLGAAIPMIFISFQAFKVSAFLSLLCLVGILMVLFCKKNQKKQIGYLLVGIGMLFIGLTLMSDAVVVFKNYQAFTNFMTNLQNPILLILVGAIFTTVIQSSLGGTAVLITLYGVSSGASLFSLTSAAFLIYGINIGTSISTSASSIGGNVNAKRTTLIHLTFNVLSMILMSLLTIFPWLTIVENLVTNKPMQIITIQLVSKILTAIIVLPLSVPLLKLAQIIIPDKAKHDLGFEDIFILSDDIFVTPTVALKQIGNNIFKLAELVKNVVDNTINAMLKKIDIDSEQLSKKREFLISAEGKITNYLIRVSGNLTEKDTEKVAIYHAILSDLYNIVHGTQKLAVVKDYNFNTEQKAQVKELYSKIKKLTDNALEILKISIDEVSQSKEECLKIFYDLDEQILGLKNSIRKKYLKSDITTDNKAQNNLNYINALNEIEYISENISNIVLRVS